MIHNAFNYKINRFTQRYVTLLRVEANTSVPLRVRETTSLNRYFEYQWQTDVVISTARAAEFQNNRGCSTLVTLFIIIINRQQINKAIHPIYIL